jgi:hypothetical protein
LQDDLNMNLDTFRDRFGDVPQKGDLTLLCPLMDDPTEKVRHATAAAAAEQQQMQRSILQAAPAAVKMSQHAYRRNSSKQAVLQSIEG